MTIRRRTVLKAAGTALAGITLPGWLGGCDDSVAAPGGCDPVDHPLPTDLPEYTYAGTPGPTDLFSHGVVSGDPTASAVILWTRVSPPTAGSVEVFWDVALDPAFMRRVAQGTTTTDATRDHTVKVDATGLRPATTYYYRFFALGVGSPVGRMRTAPSGAAARLRFAVVSCSSYAHGYFHGYAKLAEQSDLDAIIHLGDYIYEYGTGEYGNVRSYDPDKELLSLDDYRRRYKQYRLDVQLQTAHRQHPFICVWDDHEVADNAWVDGAENHDPLTEGSYAARKAAAKQAYFEYMPIREEVAGEVYRALSYGDLVDLVMLDTRHHGRSKQIGQIQDDDATRTLLGFDQESWLEQTLASSTARWVIVGQQVVVAQFTFDTATHLPSNFDSWDGYALSRARFLDAVEAHAAGRTVVLTGDIHSSWAADICRDPWDTAAYDPVTGAGSIAVEFVTPGITSPGFDPTPSGDDFFGPLVLAACPHMKFGNFVRKGYYLLDVRPDKVQADFHHLSSVTDPTGADDVVATSVATYFGEPHVVTMSGPEAPKANACAVAP